MSKVTEVVRVHVHKRCVTELLLVTSKASIMWNNQPFRQQRSWAPAKGSVLPITSNLGLSVLLKDTTSGQEQLCIETSTLAATNGWHGRPVIREVATGWAKQAIAWGPQLKAPPRPQEWLNMLAHSNNSFVRTHIDSSMIGYRRLERHNGQKTPNKAPGWM